MTLRLVAGLILLALGGLIVLEGVVIAASSSMLKGTLVGLLGFAMMTASIWLFRVTYERVVHYR